MSSRLKSVAILSYANSRKESEEVAARLESIGLITVSPKDDQNYAVDDVFGTCRTVIMMIGAEISEAARARLERDLVSYRQASDKSVSLLPVLTDGASAPVSFAGFACVRLSEGADRGYALVLSQCVQRSLESPGFRRESAGISIVQVAESSELVLGPLAISRDAQHIAFVTLTNEIHELTVSNNSIRKVDEVPGGIGRVACMRYSNSKQSVLMIGTDTGVVRVIDRSHTATCNVESSKDTRAVAVSPDGTHHAITTGGRTIMVNTSTLKVECELMHAGEVCVLNYSQCGAYLLAGTTDGQIIVWRIGQIKPIFFAQGYKTPITGVDLYDGAPTRVIASSADFSINVWDLEQSKHLAVLEGHTAPCTAVFACPKANLLVSAAKDQTIRFWNIDTGECISVEFLDETVTLVVNPQGTFFSWAAVGRERAIRLFSFDPKGAYSLSGDVVERYANAKVLVVGDSGAGKTGLTIRLTEDSFRPTISTDAAWASHLRLPTFDYPNLSNREIWLWDFAGQSDYRLIHQIFMDEAALALLVFNGQQDDPLQGLSQWNADISKVARNRTRKLLVLARADRGKLTIPLRDVELYCQDNKFSGYFETSAQTGLGCDQLRHAIVENIDWSSIPTIASPAVFKLLKEQIVAIRDGGRTLIRRDELRQQLEFHLAEKIFASSASVGFSAESDGTVDGLQANEFQFDGKGMDAAVSLLIGPGLVKRLEFGDFIVLRPERINQYASAVIRSVRMQSEEMGWIEADRVLRGEIDFPTDSVRLDPADEQILLTAMVQMLVGRGICFMQSGPAGQLLIFPYLFRRERPPTEFDEVPLVAYLLSGPLHEIYATLVVKLSLYFKNYRLWRNSADFETVEGKKIVLRLANTSGGSGMIDLAFGREISDDTKVTFIRYVNDHLKHFDAEVVRIRNYACGKCHEICADRRAIDTRIKAGHQHIFCNFCGAKIALVDAIEKNFATAETLDGARQLENTLRKLLDNESKELVLLGHAMSTVAAAGQIFRPTSNSDWGIDGEIEFKDDAGRATGRRVYLQLKSGDSYLRFRRDGKESFRIKNARHVQYWREQSSPVLLIVETSDGVVRWMNITDQLRSHWTDFQDREARAKQKDLEDQTKAVSKGKRGRVTQRQVLEYAGPSSIEFSGEPFDIRSVISLRDSFLS